MRAFVMLGVTACLAACGDSAPVMHAPGPEPAPGDNPSGVLNIAHRGYSAVAPENTLIAVERAIAAGADYIEVDVQMASDGVIVVMHDTSLARTTNVEVQHPLRPPWRVGAFTAGAITALDAGTWFTRRHPGGPDYRGEPVPTLAEVLAALDGRAGLLLEVKSPSLYPGMAPAVADTLSDAGWVVDGRAVQPLIVQSFDWDFMAEYANLHPDVPNAVLGGPPGNEDEWRFLASFTDSVNPGHARVDAAVVEEIHDRGFDISVYTVNDADRMRELVGFGVDGIISDEVERLGAVLAEARPETASATADAR
ncbi:glycerophosphodiester phosphodiesterase family protein [Algiphilus sp.]|uniref:glycerophosphodiester phosphodiesterase n=2 Tax=Algiphilus sp. TaxID=1872431 RepID=UPI0025C68995|nr:glycerophosphodiester phosphodiesterase family protein [Algiphilus sp.]MCK5769260.1 hypothetical protein [Algiphilus sp.]